MGEFNKKSSSGDEMDIIFLCLYVMMYRSTRVVLASYSSASANLHV